MAIRSDEITSIIKSAIDSFDADVDESLLGGIVVRVGSRLIDGSVRGRLERLREQLASGAL